MLHAASLELRACLGAEDEVLAGYRLHAKGTLSADAECPP